MFTKLSNQISQNAYEYQSLPSESAFRILTLLPGEPGSVIHFQLEIGDWNAISNYEAISYAWGDPEDTTECLCSQRPFRITRGLLDALNHFRLKDESRYLWADAVW